MGDVRAFVLAIGAVLIAFGLLLGWINYKIDKLKEEDKSNIEMMASIIALEKAVKKLNEALKIHEFRLDHQRDERYAIKKRLDILESGHPDTDIDYGGVDDHGEVVCVWFEGKKYVPEDKRDDETNTFYADNKVMAETTRPESRYTCADCVRFRRERVDGKWRGVCSVDNVAMSGDELYICDKFRLYRPTEYYVNKNMAETTKSEVDHLYTQYKNMGGNGKAEELPKHIVKLNYLASDTECDELLKRVERLNRIYDAGLMSLSEYGEKLKELMQNDT